MKEVNMETSPIVMIIAYIVVLGPLFWMMSFFTDLLIAAGKPVWMIPLFIIFLWVAANQFLLNIIKKDK